MSYDICKSSVHYSGRKVWGREYYHQMVPVLFQPYFEYSKKPFGKYPAWENVDGKLTRKKDIHGNNLSTWRFNWWNETVYGVKGVWHDLPRIIRKQWYWETTEVKE